MVHPSAAEGLSTWMYQMLMNTEYILDLSHIVFSIVNEWFVLFELALASFKIVACGNHILVKKVKTRGQVQMLQKCLSLRHCCSICT